MIFVSYKNVDCKIRFKVKVTHYNILVNLDIIHIYFHTVQ